MKENCGLRNVYCGLKLKDEPVFVDFSCTTIALVGVFTNKPFAAKFSALLIAFLAFSSQTNAQVERHYLRQGNKKYNDKNYEEAQINYRKALNEDGNSYASNFNLGDALYQQGDFNGAAQKFETAASVAKDKIEKAKALHNMGNAFLKADRLTQAIDAYKQALRNNPNDQETKYNLSYALKKQKEQQEQQKQNKENEKDKDKQKQQDKDQQDKQDEKDKNNQQNQDQDKDKEKQDQDKSDQDKKDKDNQRQEDNGDNGQDKPKDDEKESKDKQQQQPQQGRMSDAEAQRILDALKSEEQKVQQRIFQRNKDQQRNSRAKGKQW